MPRRYILWDHDGVLVDSERWFFAATRDVMRRIGIELSHETLTA
jgi:beta-phosphoglucomutase-like phosphatase (HAD superfamily)